MLTHTNNIRAISQKTERQHKEQLDVNSALWNKVGNVDKDIDSVSRSAAAFATLATEKIGQQQASLSLRVDELKSILFESRAASPVNRAVIPSIPKSNQHRESSSEDSDDELGILGICSGKK